MEISEDFIFNLLKQNQEFLQSLLQQNNDLMKSFFENNESSVFSDLKEHSLNHTGNGKIGGRRKSVKALAKKLGIPEKCLKLNEVDLSDDEVYLKYKEVDFLKQFKPVDKPKKAKVKLTVEEVVKAKKDEFAKSLSPFVEKYGKDMCNDFYRYWGQPIRLNGGKMSGKLAWEAEKKWELSMRLATWSNSPINQKKQQGQQGQTPKTVVSNGKLLGTYGQQQKGE
jgi:hypothetical protein